MAKYNHIDLLRKHKKPFVTAFIIRRMQDTDPDLSFLKQYDNYAGSDITTEEAGKYAAQDRQRLDAYEKQEWWMIGIRAECEYVLPSGMFDGKDRESGIIQKLTSGGLWGIESDSEESYFKDIAEDELSELKRYCKILGIMFNKKTPVIHRDG